MKKNLHYIVNASFLLAGILAYTINCTAQIVIHQADMPSIGTNAVMAIDNTTVLSPQNPSPAPQTWNYSGLKNTQTNAYMFVSPVNTPYYSAFHSSNLADTLVYASGYTYYSSTADSFSATGFGEYLEGYRVGITFHPLFKQTPLPATYGTDDKGQCAGDTSMAFSYLTFDSARVKVNITYSDTIDAWGVMTTPYGTDSVIRQKHHDLTVDSAFAHNKLPKGWITYTVTTTENYQYRWYAKGINYFFAVMQMNSTGTKDSLVQWYDGANLGINQLSETDGQLSVYPNPCSNEITFEPSVASGQWSVITVYDITGRQIAQFNTSHSTSNTLNTSSFSNGLYLYNLTDRNGNVLERGKFAVQK